MNQEYNKTFIYVVIAVLAAAVLIYFFAKLPEFASKRGKELAESREVRVTIPEGYSVRQIGEALLRAGLFSKDDFVRAAAKEEGFLFPDTYRFYKTSTPDEVISRMRANFDSKITPAIINEIQQQRKTLKDVVIIASILEEEARGEEDRKLVSGILWKRLKEGIGLQVDATLTYILDKSTKDLTQSDLAIDSPYNTYRYRGLPQTPISNPGMETILAAIYPSPSPYFYYLSDDDGQIHYARTFEEHKLNKFKYIR